jgi:hypothetical protein
MKSAVYLGAALLTLSLTAAVEAQQRPPQRPDAWCRDQGLSRGSVMICEAYTFEQCMASRTSHIESCYPNPRYDPRYRRG